MRKPKVITCKHFVSLSTCLSPPCTSPSIMQEIIMIWSMASYVSLPPSHPSFFCLNLFFVILFRFIIRFRFLFSFLSLSLHSFLLSHSPFTCPSIM